MPRIHSAVFAAIAAVAGNAMAQAANEFDFDPTQLPLATIPPSGATHHIATAVTYTGQNLVLNAPLVVHAGAELRLERSVLRVRGNILLEDGGRITVIDSSLLLPCQFQEQYQLRMDGGLLHTERAVVGATYDGPTLFFTALRLLRGTWLARQTVVQGLVVTLSDGRQGWFGNPALKGGSLFADGLYEGDRADFVHMAGMGDAVLENGTMNVALYYDAGSSTQPVAATIDLDSRRPLDVVYGDPFVHSGVTAPLALHPCRLELRNHRSATWALMARNATPAGPLQTITLQNAEDIICSFRGTNLTGAPLLGGPWSSHYAQLPGLPSTGRPGHHAIPPGCSVRLGNVQFQSGPGANDWNRIREWALYTSGAGTNLAVTGPTKIGEILMHGGNLSLAGTGSFDMGLVANVVRLFQGASLQLTDVSLGQFGTYSVVTGLIEANDNSVCTITNARSASMRLKTTSPGASISAQNVFGGEHLVLDSAGGGSVQFVQATPGQNWDLQNAGFESALLGGGVPAYWFAQAVTGSLVADPAPGSAGATAYALTASAANAALQKQLVLPAETFVDVVGAAKVTTPPPGGAQLLLQAFQGPNVASKALALAPLNTWQRVQVPQLAVGSGPGATFVKFYAAGLPAAVRLDDIRVNLGSWWDDDNFVNLGFELDYRDRGAAPTYWSAPDAWRAYQVTCAPDPAILRPGAAPGSRSTRVTLQQATGNLYKILTFLRGGDTAVVRGFARGVSANPNARSAIIIGNGPTYYALQPPNQHSPGLPCDGLWRSFQLTYVVPSNPSYTRLDVYMSDAIGSQFWFDDFTVEIQ